MACCQFPAPVPSKVSDSPIDINDEVEEPENTLEYHRGCKVAQAIQDETEADGFHKQQLMFMLEEDPKDEENERKTNAEEDFEEFSQRIVQHFGEREGFVDAAFPFPPLSSVGDVVESGGMGNKKPQEVIDAAIYELSLSSCSSSSFFDGEVDYLIDALHKMENNFDG